MACNWAWSHWHINGHVKHFSCQLHLGEADAGAVCDDPAAMLPLPVPTCTELLSGYTTGPCRSPLLEKKKKWEGGKREEGRRKVHVRCLMYWTLSYSMPISFSVWLLLTSVARLPMFAFKHRRRQQPNGPLVYKPRVACCHVIPYSGLWFISVPIQLYPVWSCVAYGPYHFLHLMHIHIKKTFSSRSIYKLLMWNFFTINSKTYI